MSILLYKSTRELVISFLSGAISLACYLITFDSINEELFNFSTTAESVLIPGAGWLLLGAVALLLQKERGFATGFAWVGHVYLIPILSVAFIIYGDQAMWSYLLATGVYAASISFVKKEWKVKSFLYGSFTTLFLAIKTGIIYITGVDSGHYAFLTASILIACFWLLSSSTYKQRTIYYLVPFSLLGMASFQVTYPFTWMLFGITVGYAAAVLYLLHRSKWDIAAIVPLIMVFYGTVQVMHQEGLYIYWSIAILAVFGLVLIFSGKWIYQNLWEKGDAFGLVNLDAYTLVGLLYIASIASMYTETFWALIIHGLLMSAGLWLQRNRTKGIGATMISFTAGAYLLIPYYAAVQQMQIPSLWEREIYVLPFVALVIFLKFIFKGKSGKITSYIQWAVLVIVSLLLIQDGLASNTVYDALILGSLSLISMLAGMWLRIKSYFFVGAGVLLLNLILQTRPFWGNLPWWGYLLVAGSILIGVASFNEWNKQKGAKGEKTLIQKLKENLLLKMKNWN